jgi:hypothetical protein
MAHRHKHHKAHGGKVFYSGGESKVAKEAEERKHGGKVEAHMHHKKGHHRLDKRARGGGVGSDKSPFSSAYRSGDENAGEHGPHGKRG